MGTGEWRSRAVGGLWDSEVLWVGAVSSRGGGDLGVGSKGWST